MRWEYKTIQYNKPNYLGGAMDLDSGEFNDLLNKLGGEGWELVNMVANPSGWSGRGFVLMFKKPR